MEAVLGVLAFAAVCYGIYYVATKKSKKDEGPGVKPGSGSGSRGGGQTGRQERR